MPLEKVGSLQEPQLLTQFPFTGQVNLLIHKPKMKIQNFLEKKFKQKH